ncbi:Piwi domain-containing protein [Boletus edulis BED1]|uniref:Piwi domain-containing protein n=1 Tax=Boletus edulis BED1 TaxID=1328754 RepID=A0AAD4BQW6_BOLED|nr:Piwi domain-containing protein [Boletus edulis BED1]
MTVTFNTERLSRKSDARRRIEIFERLQNHAQPDVFKPKVIYDSDAIAYSSRVLPFGNAATFDVNMSDRAPREGAGQPRGIFRITLKRVDAAPVSFEDLQHLIDGRTTQLTSRADVALTLVQLIVRQAPNLKYPNNVKAFFCREAGSRALGGGLEVFRGYYQSVRPTLRTLLVNIDTTCGVIYQEGPMPEVALNFLGSTHPRDLNLSERDPKLAKLKKFFSGIFITFTHRKNKKKIQSIIPQAGSQKFEWNKDKNEGVVQTTTVQAYFREAYNITLRYPDAIGVKIGGGSIVPIELCVIAPDQRFTRKLPQELTKKMVEFTSDKPKARLESIRRGIVGAGAALDYATSPFVRDAEMEVSTTPTMIDGKVLSTPEMQYKRGTQVPRFGAWNVMNQQFREPQNIACWAVVDYGHPKDRPANERFARMISENCQKLGMSIVPLQTYVTGNGSNVTQDLIQAAKKAAAAHNVGQPDLIVVILPSSAAEIRFDVKRYGDVLHGVVTQCVRVDKVARANDQYCNNVAMKINAKLGGVNTVPNASVLMNLAKSAYMIMGADVGHPAPGVLDQPSVASLVASYDRQAMKYRAYTTIQPPRMETIEELQHMIFRALDDFGQEHRRAPEKIIFFRDGLSEGEYRNVAEKEFKDIKDAIERVWKERGLPPQMKRPAVTFIVVGKRHHVRFFPQNERDADRSGNCPAGFVADEGIGNPIAKDYYLLSHGGLLGTSRPSHYIVIQDENFSNNKEVLQELSFALCHAYARATRSVSIPAPVYYADLVCGRANFHFAPELKYDDSSASVTSDKSHFNIERWRSGFQGAHSNMSKKMFYM